MSFWKANRNCLLNGKLRAENPEAGYSIVSAETEKKIISVSYIKNILKVDKKYEEIIFVNGSWEKELLINSRIDKYSVKYQIYDCTGNIVEQSSIVLNFGINLFNVPYSGMVRIYL